MTEQSKTAEPVGNETSRPRLPMWVRVVIGVLLVPVGIVAYAVFVNQPSNQELLRQAERALDLARFEHAESLAQRVLKRDAESTVALLIAGKAALMQAHHEDAVSYYDRIPDDGAPDAVMARCDAGRILLEHVKRPFEAERRFRQALKHDPDNPIANAHMAYLLGLAGRSREAIPFRLKSIQLKQINAVQLYLFVSGGQIIENADLLEELHLADDDDPITVMGMSRLAADYREFVQAEKMLRQVIREQPAWMDAQARLGKLLLETATAKKFVKWQAALPDAADEHPDIWTLRGLWAKQAGQLRAAARCFWEAVRLDPNQQQANYQLGQILLSLKRPEDAQVFLERSSALQRYLSKVILAKTGDDVDAVFNAIELAESLGLLWEAYGWSEAAMHLNPHPAWAIRKVANLGSRLPKLPLKRTSPSPQFHPVNQVDLAGFPTPNWPVANNGDQPAPRRAELLSKVRFVDDARAAGLKFSFFNGSQPLQTGLQKMYEAVGGGVAVIDFDLDGWPDLHFPQGTAGPLEKQPSQYSDRLFRNLGNDRFEDVTTVAGVTETNFSQGATAADFDNDGFPDLFVTNIGRNRLFHNNGDGTFTDVSDRLPAGGRDSWSTSCVIADLNGDRLPDIYVVGYLSGDKVFTMVCPDEKGVPKMCHPHAFPAAQDQLWLNLGDGRFEDVTSQCGIQVSQGKGLGIVAADFDGSGRLNLFIANDTVENFYFVNQTPELGAPPQFTQLGMLQGLGVNQGGLAEACMGIAIDDFNGDQLLDLFVTNFYRESNTLFLQRVGHTFSDETGAANLVGPSLRKLGWGTQSLDADLDGWPDLLIANGHITNVADAGDGPFQMRPQYMQNNGGQFIEPSAKDLGPYFEGAYLGRGMAKLDWNRDGLEDAVIVHLDAPVALLTNKTQRAGHFVSFELIGVESARDAIGTTVTLKTPARTTVRQLTAGDGFLACNQRRLVFGLGKQTQISELTVRWPTGKEQYFENVPVDTELVLIEGRLESFQRRIKH